MAFRVTVIIDGDTFEITPNWEFNGQTGNRVRPTGYDAPEIGTPNSRIATEALGRLILGKDVVLTNPVRIDRGRLVCDVLLNGQNIASRFGQFRR